MTTQSFKEIKTQICVPKMSEIFVKVPLMKIYVKTKTALL